MKLVIFMTEARMHHLETDTNPVIILFPSWSRDLEDYGATWAMLWRDDVVMLVEEDS